MHNKFCGQGLSSYLFRYLFDHFAKAKDSANLERIVSKSRERKSDEKYMLDRLFDYYKAQGDYEGAKAALLDAYNAMRTRRYYSGYYKEYKRMKSFLNSSDWNDVEPEIFDQIKDENLLEYLEICLDKNMKETVLDIILNPPRGHRRFIYGSDLDKFANRLKGDYPTEIIEYYWKRAYVNIPGGTRKTYRIAADYLRIVKHIYIKLLNDADTWNKRFSELRAEFKNRPAFLEEVQGV